MNDVADPCSRCLHARLQHENTRGGPCYPCTECVCFSYVFLEDEIPQDCTAAERRLLATIIEHYNSLPAEKQIQVDRNIREFRKNYLGREEKSDA